MWVYVRYSVQYVQPEWCTFVRVCVYVYVNGGLCVQSELCIHRREYGCMFIYVV